jgi:hypothetical protein
MHAESVMLVFSSYLLLRFEVRIKELVKDERDSMKLFKV